MSPRFVLGRENVPCVAEVVNRSLKADCTDFTGIFFQYGLIFLENDKNWFSFVFTMLPKHIKIKSPLKYKSVCGRQVKPSGLSTALLAYNCFVRVSTVLDSSIIFFYNFELVYCLPAFYC